VRPNPPLQPTAAREIVGFLTRFGGALAAADGQPVGRVTLSSLTAYRCTCCCATIS